MPRLQDGGSQFARDRHAYALAASAALGSIFYGWDIGLIGGILSMASFQKYFGLDKQSQKDRDNLSGNIVSVLQAGCLCVSMFGLRNSEGSSADHLVPVLVLYLLATLRHDSGANRLLLPRASSTLLDPSSKLSSDCTCRNLPDSAYSVSTLRGCS
jgi:hypothetical protein